MIELISRWWRRRCALRKRVRPSAGFAAGTQTFETRQMVAGGVALVAGSLAMYGVTAGAHRESNEFESSDATTNEADFDRSNVQLTNSADQDGDNSVDLPSEAPLTRTSAGAGETHRVRDLIAIGIAATLLGESVSLTESRQRSRRDDSADSVTAPVFGDVDPDRVFATMEF